MLIRFGYDLTFICPAPVQMLCLLDAHPDHHGQLVSGSPLSLTPTTSVRKFTDTFGNRVTRFTAPASTTRMTRDMIIEFDGFPQPTAPFAQQTEVEDMPPAVLAYLYGSRYCDTDRLDALHGLYSGGQDRDGSASRLSAITSIVKYVSATNTRDPRVPPTKPMKNGWASVAISLISPSRSAVVSIVRRATPMAFLATSASRQILLQWTIMRGSRLTSTAGGGSSTPDTMPRASDVSL